MVSALFFHGAKPFGPDFSAKQQVTSPQIKPPPE
jgi:hypothetical protein